MSSLPALGRSRRRRPFAVLALALATALALVGSLLVASPAQAATGKVTGVVKARYAGGSAAPIADVQVVLDKLTSDGWSYDNAVRTTMSNASGRYSVSGLANGRYRVRFYSADHSTTGGLGHEYYDNKWSPYDNADVRVSGGTVTLKEVLLEQPGWVTGTVRDEAGNPMPNASVMVTDGPLSGGYGVSAASNGTYSTRQGLTRNTIPGTYHVEASAGDYAIGRPVYSSSSTTVKVAANKAVTQDFVLKRLKTATFTVLDTNGSPLRGAPLQIWYRPTPTDSFAPIRYGPNETDDQGRYRFVEGWEYKVRFLLPPGYTGTGHPEYWDGPQGQGAYAFADAAVLGWAGSTVDRSFTVRLGAAPAIKPGVPQISGTAAVGRTLVADPGTWTPADVVPSYQWLRDGAEIPGATSRTLKVTAPLAESAISVRVTGRRPGSAAAPAVDVLAPKEVKVAKASLKPKKPRVTGKAKVGKRLKVKPGAWGPRPVTLKYQWLRNGKVVKKATKKTYRLTRKDRGKRISVRVTGSRAGYTTLTRTSKATAKVKR